jgi:quercetin dioxygenase-like cupin family protein
VDRKLTAYLAHFEATDESPAEERYHSHEGVEFLHLLTGTLRLLCGEDTHELQAGDSVYFDSSVPHTYVRVGDAACTALVATVP